MSEIVYYLSEAEAKAHGKVEAVVTVLHVHRLKAKSDNPAVPDVEAEATDERIWDDQDDIRELAEDEAVEEERVYYKVLLPDRFWEAKS